jgi:hypothetical protein
MEQSSTNNKRSKITELFQGWVRSNGIIQNIKSQIYIHFYLQKTGLIKISNTQI